MESRLLTALADGEIESALRPAKEGMDEELKMEIACFQDVADIQNGILRRISPNEVVFHSGNTSGKIEFVLDETNPKTCTYIMDEGHPREAHIEFCKCMAAVVDCGEVIVVAPKRFFIVEHNYRSKLLNMLHNNPEFNIMTMNPPSYVAPEEMQLYYNLRSGMISFKRRSCDQVMVMRDGEMSHLILYRRSTSGDFIIYPQNGSHSFVADLEMCAQMAVLISHDTGEVVLVFDAADLKFFD